MDKATLYIKKLGLEPHPEGGFFKETYRSAEILPGMCLPRRYGAQRNVSTQIYFLLRGHQVSRFHKLKSDEVWHHYDGSAVIIYVLDDKGNYNKICLGKNIEEGECFQAVIKKESWFAAEVVEKESYVLVGCSVAPGFDFADFELAQKDKLLAQYPENSELIEKFTLR